MAAQARAEGEAKAHGEEVFKRIGWRGIITTLLEKSYFEKSGTGKTKLECVYEASFETAVRLLSLQNATR